MNRKKLSILYLCIIFLMGTFFTGCSTRTPQVQFYSLVDTSLTSPATARHDELTISVGPVILPVILQQRQIATGGRNGRYNRSEFHRWAGGLDRDFGMAISEQLAASLGTERVFLYPGVKNVTPDWRVALEIIAMEGALGEEALLTVRWTLIDPENRELTNVLRSRFRHVPQDDTYRSWIEAQRLNIANLGSVISSALLQQIDN